MRPAAAAAASPPRRPRRRRGARPLVLGLLVLLLGALGLGGVELGGDQRVVLGAQIDLVVEVHGSGVGLGGRLEALLALEGLNLLNGDLELMRDPRVRPSLADPCADPVQLGAK